MAAESRTVWVTACCTEFPHSSWPGPIDTRPRLGLSPTSPHMAAGIRMEPPPSDAFAAGSMPTATAAAAPPEDPPVPRDVSHGLQDGP